MAIGTAFGRTGSGPSLAPVRDRHQLSPRLLSEEVVQHLAGLILDGRLKPNEKLPSERDLAAQLGVSRTVIRSAVAVLIERGLVEVRSGRGTFVSTGSERTATNFLNLLVRRDQISLAELIEARLFLEERVANLAARRAKEADAAELEQALGAMRESRHRPFAFVEADLAFHEALARAAHNGIFVSFLGSIRGVLAEGMLLGSAVPGAAESSVAEHAAILRAVRAGDAAAAERAMAEHLASSYRQQVQAGYVPDQSQQRAEALAAPVREEG